MWESTVSATDYDHMQDSGIRTTDVVSSKLKTELRRQLQSLQEKKPRPEGAEISPVSHS